MTTYQAADATLLGAGRAEGTSRRAVTPAEPRTLAAASAAAVDTLFTAILCALPLTELHTTYSDWGFLAVGGAGIALGLALGHLAVRLRLPAALTALSAVLGYLVIGGPLLDRADCVAGFVPTPLALRTLADTAVGGWKQLLTTPIPVSASGTLLAVPFILALVLRPAEPRHRAALRRRSRAARPAAAPARRHDRPRYPGARSLGTDRRGDRSPLPRLERAASQARRRLGGGRSRCAGRAEEAVQARRRPRGCRRRRRTHPRYQPSAAR